MISVMALLDRNYIRQTTVSRGNAVVEKSISSAPFFQVIFTTHLPIVIIKCLQEMMVQSVPIKTNISQQFTQEHTPLLTSGRKIPCCHL